jgi:hypothetical protein
MAQRSVLSACDWMGDQIYYLELLYASESTLSCWSRLHLQSLVPTPVSMRVAVRLAAGRKIIAESIHNMMKNMLYRPHLGIRVGTRRIGFEEE